MSRLDSAIRRLQAQRNCLDQAVAAITDVPGPVFELGLGNGRTYDHLRSKLVGRDIFVFDRQVAAHPDCIPDAEHLILGDIRETLPAATTRFGGRVAMIHTDIGTGDADSNADIAAFIASMVPAFLTSGGIVVSDQDLGAGGALNGAVALPLPDGVKPGRYYMYRF